jgi:transcriptional regulator with XRE-family HTH domain
MAMSAPERSGVETPEVKKRRLRLALRRARIKAKLSQKTAAEELVWSISKIVRIEQGTVPVAPTDVRAMLHLYQVTDEAQVNRLVELAKQAREDKGWAAFDDILSPATRELVGNEPAATVVYAYEPAVVPGLFQTQDYTRSLLHVLGESDANVTRRLEVRSKRQRLIDENPRPELNVILGEAALVRPVGDKDIMREQIAHLLELSREPGINLWLLPFSAGAHRGMGSAFTILQFEDLMLSDFLYLENAERVSSSHDEEADIKKYLELFVELQKMAEDSGTFEELVQRIVVPLYPPSSA